MRIYQRKDGFIIRGGFMNPLKEQFREVQNNTGGIGDMKKETWETLETWETWKDRMGDIEK